MPDTSPPDDPKAKALAIHARLCAEYGCPIAYFQDLDPHERKRQARAAG